MDQRALVTKILEILKPQVTSAVNSAIAAQEAAERQRQAAVREQQRQAALREQQRQAAIREQQRLEAERQAALREQQRQAALREQQRLEAQRQAALLEQQRQAALLREQQRLEAERQAALLASQQQASGLSGLFGTGHEYAAQIPGQSRVEYHIGSGQAATVGFTPGQLQSRPRYG